MVYYLLLVFRYLAEIGLLILVLLGIHKFKVSNFLANSVNVEEFIIRLCRSVKELVYRLRSRVLATINIACTHSSSTGGNVDFAKQTLQDRFLDLSA